jgi:hypothetical protein
VKFQQVENSIYNAISFSSHHTYLGMPQLKVTTIGGQPLANCNNLFERPAAFKKPQGESQQPKNSMMGTSFKNTQSGTTKTQCGQPQPHTNII